METLTNRCECPPYYCHYMSWRLGTWEDESLFHRLEELFCCAEALPDWKHEQGLLAAPEFADFWSLVWQLQVAEYLGKVGNDVRWAKSGPDLSVKLDNKRLYVECYTFRKSFGLLKFLEELLRQIDSSLRTSYDLALPFQLPKNADRNRFLDEILRPFLDPKKLAEAKEAAKREYPVLLYKAPESSLHVYIDGDDVDAHMPGIVPNQVGDPKSYVERVLREAVKAKRCENDLANHRPNLLAVNYLLSEDLQVAGWLRKRVQSPTLPRIDPNIDALAVSVVGIDQWLTREELKVLVRSDGNAYSFLDQIASQCPESEIRWFYFVNFIGKTIHIVIKTSELRVAVARRLPDEPRTDRGGGHAQPVSFEVHRHRAGPRAGERERWRCWGWRGELVVQERVEPRGLAELRGF